VKEGKLPQELRARVTSKGGTTEAAIQTMEARNFKSIVNEANKFCISTVKRTWKIRNY
jgi:pyrroline-5-carboxylate reductase